ncbi:MAG TPA: 50S ribosomal protein L15 [Candidatus Saccharimonadales bacterium]|nr:50S ribosomal protein L15 [Candidatus Saccharimonadales bacterium]
MKYNELQTAGHKSRKRVGRGIAAGQGKTAGRGTKGQGARTGFSKRPGFEGGQNPLMQRLPKLHGFRSFKVRAENVFTDQLDKLGAKVTNETLAAAGLVSSSYASVKLLKRGDVTKKVTVELQAASQTAIEAVQKAGGDFKVTPRVMRPVTKKKAEK